MTDRTPQQPVASDLVERLMVWRRSEFGQSPPGMMFEEAADALASREAAQATLFDAIQHGDDEHRAWLKEAIDAHFTGQPVPEPKGSGRKDAELASLKRKLAEAVGVMKEGERLIRWQAKTTGCSDQLYGWLDTARAILEQQENGK